VDTTITTLEFCAGYGGIGLGLKNIFGERMRTIAYCELEGFAQANLISKMEKGLLDVAPIWNDLKTFPYRKFHGLVDIFVAGYPCQPFSSAGKRAGKEDPRHLWPWIADGIRLLQPRMCFFENVEGHISLGLSTVISDLEELGYKSSFGIFSASEVGAVHQRKRVFIMAHNKSQARGGLCERTQTQESKFGFNCEARIGTWPSRPGELADAQLHGCHNADQRPNQHGVEGALGKATAKSTRWSGFYSSQHRQAVGNGQIWPSRPGEPQHGWEPPRVVDSNSARQQTQRNESNSQRREGFTSEPSELENPKLVGRRGRRDGDAGGLRGEIQTAGSCGGGAEAMGNAECFRLESTRNDGTMEKESGSSSAERREPSYATKKSSNSNISFSEIKSEMGRDIDGNTYGVDISELSGLCDSELAEIREWMVKGDNRTDELRSCGNGVVPATAERAFRVLMEELKTI